MMLLAVQLLLVALVTIRVDAFSPSPFGVRSSPIRQTTKHYLPNTSLLQLQPSSRLYSSSNDDVDNDTATKEVISTMGKVRVSIVYLMKIRVLHLAFMLRIFASRMH